MGVTIVTPDRQVRPSAALASLRQASALVEMCVTMDSTIGSVSIIL